MTWVLIIRLKTGGCMCAIPPVAGAAAAAAAAAARVILMLELGTLFFLKPIYSNIMQTNVFSGIIHKFKY